MRASSIKMRLGLNPHEDEPYVTDAEMDELGTVERVAQTIIVRAIDRAANAQGVLSDGPKRYAEAIRKRIANAG